MTDELRGAALRPDAPLGKRRLVDAVDDPGAGDQRVLAPLDRAANEPHGGLRFLVLRGHQRARGVRPQLAPPRLRHPVGVRVAQCRLCRRALGKRYAEVACAVREPPEHRIRERHRPLEPRLPHELDRLVDGRVARHAVHERQLVRAESEGIADGAVELPHGALPERLDRVVERARPLNGAEREPPGEGAIALVERSRLGPQHPVCIGVVLEDPPHDGERDPPGRRHGAHRRPRRQASALMRRPPSGCTSTGSNDPSSPIRALHTVTGGPRAPRARRCGTQGPDDADELLGRPVEIELPVGRADLLGVGRRSGLRRELRSRAGEDAVEEARRDLHRRS